MANESKKTEHSGSKKGNGAFWGPKKEAKHQSKRQRRENDKAASELKEQDKEIDPFLIHEALDRSHIMLDQLQRTLGEHPAIRMDEQAQLLYENAVESLSKLYQLLGSRSFG